MLNDKCNKIENALNLKLLVILGENCFNMYYTCSRPRMTVKTKKLRTAWKALYLWAGWLLQVEICILGLIKLMVTLQFLWLYWKRKFLLYGVCVPFAPVFILMVLSLWLMLCTRICLGECTDWLLRNYLESYTDWNEFICKIAKIPFYVWSTDENTTN